MIEESALKNLRAKISGGVLTSDDAAYDEARRIHNGMFVRSPAIIARCVVTADIVEAIRFALNHGLELAVRGGGHSVAGKSSCDGGLMLDLSLMKRVTVNPNQRTARAEAGVTWGEFNRETQLHGLATTGGVVSTTGIAGLTLGGGLGWLMGKYGLAADNLVAAEVITATGDVVRANATENSDLFWGLRGGGGNFGVVSSFEYQLHSVGPVTSGLVAYPIERAREVLRFYRDATSSAPDELISHGALTHAPDGSGIPLAAIVVCHSGSLAEGEDVVRPIKSFETPLVDTIGVATYVDTNTQIYDPGFPRGARNYWKSSFLEHLNDAVIDILCTHFAVCPSPMSGLLLEHFHGAATRVGIDETAFGHRNEAYNVLIVSEWLDARDDEKNIAWARSTYDALRPHLSEASYANYQTEDESEQAVERAYGPNSARLVDLKNRWDPTNFFHLNSNIRPTLQTRGAGSELGT